MAKKNAKVSIMPLGDRVLVKPEEATSEKSAAGLHIPETAKKEKPETGTVVAVGAGKRMDDGKVIPLSVKVGDTVMFSKYGYDEIKVEGTTYYILTESNILGIIK